MEPDRLGLGFYSWIIAIFILIISIIMLIISSLTDAFNPTLIDFWKNVFQACFYLVISIPIALYGILKKEAR